MMYVPVHQGRCTRTRLIRACMFLVASKDLRMVDAGLHLQGFVM
jgi:hypothetical protein